MNALLSIITQPPKPGSIGRMFMAASTATCPACLKRATISDQPLAPIVEVFCACGYYTVWDLFDLSKMKEN